MGCGSSSSNAPEPQKVSPNGEAKPGASAAAAGAPSSPPEKPEARKSSRSGSTGAQKKGSMKKSGSVLTPGPPDLSDARQVALATLRLQTFARKWIARNETRRRQQWQIYTRLEYQNEADQVHMYEFFNQMLASLPENERVPREERVNATLNVARQLAAQAHGSQLAKMTSDAGDAEAIDAFIDPDLVPVEPEFAGARLEGQLTAGKLLELVDSVRGGAVVHAKYALQILQGAIKIIGDKPNVVHVPLNFAKQLTVVGDIHGQLADLLLIFSKNGVPSTENPYLFNGDFVDRGKNSVEVALILLGYCVLYPTSVFINRGNHEDQVLNMQYGFVKEVIRKYDDLAFYVLKHFEVLFSVLPIAHVVDNRVFVVHGGITERTDLEFIATIQRAKFISLMNPPSKRADDFQQMADMLWSDPHNKKGCLKSDRGAGYFYGPDTTLAFCQKYKFEFIIRSHECVENGWDSKHDGRVITIFSASDYYDPGSNYGAYMKLYAGGAAPVYTAFMASKVEGKPVTVRQRVGVCEEGALREMAKLLQDNREALAAGFRAKDQKDTGRLRVKEWYAVLEAVIPVKRLPWLGLREHIVQYAPGSNCAEVLYMTCLDAQSVTFTSKGGQAHDSSVSDQLYKNRAQLEMVFRLMDTNNSGSVTVDEFRAAVRVLNKVKVVIPEDSIEKMAAAMDLDHDGTINFNEFLESFRLVQKAEPGH